MHQPRKQARQARAKVTQEAIVEAAARILEEQGRDALTTNRIALRAGVSIGSLYQYFPNKEAIFAAIIRAKRAELLARMERALADSASLSPEEAADALVRAGMMHQFTRPRLALEVEALEPHLRLQEETAETSARIADLVLQTIRRIDPAAGPGEAGDVVALCKGLIRDAALTDGPGGEDLHRRCMRAVLGYLRCT